MDRAGTLAGHRRRTGRRRGRRAASPGARRRAPRHRARRPRGPHRPTAGAGDREGADGGERLDPDGERKTGRHLHVAAAANSSRHAFASRATASGVARRAASSHWRPAGDAASGHASAAAAAASDASLVAAASTARGARRMSASARPRSTGPARSGNRSPFGNWLFEPRFAKRFFPAPIAPISTGS